MSELEGPDADADSTLDAGDFSSWLGGMERALRGEQDSDVPCGECTACCTSSQFVHIGPDETDSLAHIPGRLLFRAPLMPAGHVLMGYDEHGRCPMLIDNRCSIYEHRPRTCRTYDCRVFPATAVELRQDDDPDKELIARRARRWRFDHPSELDRVRHDAVIAAAAFVADHLAELPDDMAPSNSTQLAVAAVRAHSVFLGRATPDVAAIKVVLTDRAPTS